jgi:dihydroorotate dehydrogenase (NAD+) catalytic subunit
VAARLSSGNGDGSVVDLGVELAGLELSHPVLNGSGTFDAIAALRSFGGALRESFPFSAFVSKTITVDPRGGNRPPRLWEAPAGMINSIGLPNKGLAGFLEHDLPELATLPVPLIVSVAGFDYDQFAHLVEDVAKSPEIAALELNVSCPNVKSGCVMGSDPDEITALIDRVRPLTDKALIVKLTPNVADVAPIAEASEAAGADAVSLINTLRAMPIDPDTGRPWLGAERGGLSGPAVRAVALEMTYEVRSRTTLPVIGMGGLESGRDAFDFLSAGADLVAVGTENFRDPAAGIRVCQELQALMIERSLRNLREVRGSSPLLGPA